MPPKLSPQQEAKRLLALTGLSVLDTQPEDEFDALVEAAALLCKVPISLISLVDKDRQWFKANYGLSDVSETSRDISFCAQAILGEELFEVCDASVDPRFAGNSLVTGTPGIRFYAGVPLRLDGGENIGTICVIDNRPRQLTGTQRAILIRLSKAAIELFKSRRTVHDLAASEHRFRELSAKLADQHELLQVTLRSIGDAVITTDLRGRITWLNPAAERITGWLSSDAVGRPTEQVFNIVHQETLQPAPNPIQACLIKGETVGLANRTILISRNGSHYGVEDSAAPIRNAQGEMLGTVLVFHDVTEQRRLAGEMSYRATHDALTDLANRTEFEFRLRRVLEISQESNIGHALMYIDLDQFKLVNDACGHTVGDQLLRQVADLLGETVRSRDTVARLGGDEFAIILEGYTANQAQVAAQNICDRMDDFRFAHDDQRFRLGASIGLVAIDKRWGDLTALMKAADSACYAAKEGGRNRVHLWFDTDQIMRTRHDEMRWASRLEQALDEDRFKLYAQRIKSLTDTSSGCHAEVLVRMIDADGTVIQPGFFLPAAERFHLASRVDRWVLRHAIACLVALKNLSKVHLLCINVSGQSVGDRVFHRDALAMLTLAGPETCQRICLEITETAAVTAMADAVVFIEQIQALGVKVALDDFGAGASSFGYLKTMNIDIIKIDGQFIEDLISDPLDAATVRCFVEIANLVGAQTVAEFVSGSDILGRVKELGIDYAQGSTVHRPEPIEAVINDASLSINHFGQDL